MVNEPNFPFDFQAHIREMMTAAALLVVLGAALAMEASGLQWRWVHSLRV